MKLLTSLFVTALTLGASASITNVRDIFEHSCVECHNEKKDKGGLRMDLKANFFEGGDSGSPVDFKTPDQSELLRRVLLAHDDDEFMPPSSKKKERKPLTQEEIARLKNWIVNGAKWDEKITLQHRERSTTKEDYSKPDPDLASIAVYPTSITLETKRDFHRLIILATDKNAVTRNVTSSVKFTIADPSLTRIEGSTLFPIKDGATTVNISFRGKALTIPVVIKNAVKDRRVSFQQDVVPVFTAAGCNTGACHGSARGQDGFMISLFGYDPKGDYQRVTREFAGRRINLALPEESLLLTKTIGTVPHTGGKLFEKDSPFYSTLLEWIKDGANYDPAEIALPVKIEVEPKEFLLEGSGKDIPLTVKATYSDGTDRDVSTLSNYTSSNDNSISVDASSGVTSSKTQGEAFLMARFHTFTEGSMAIVIPEGLKYTQPKLKQFNYIDKHVHEKLHKLRIIPSEICSDEIFIRRVYLDIIGLLPTEKELKVFVSDTNPKKRDRLVDELLERKDFTELWVMKWAELLQIRTTGNNSNDVTYKSA
ncbi:DUF1549 domain-containing protein, partial [bacterium]|nr:DUF1549 domain-containing protein [bacterium]